MIKKTGMAIALLLTCQVASAAGWRLIGRASSFNLYVNSGTVRQMRHGLRQFQTRQIYHHPQTATGLPRRIFTSIHAISMVDCRRHRIGMMAESLFDRHGRRVDYYAVPIAQVEYEPVKAGTLGALEYRTVCRAPVRKKK